MCNETFKSKEIKQFIRKKLKYLNNEFIRFEEKDIIRKIKSQKPTEKYFELEKGSFLKKCSIKKKKEF